MTGSTRLQRESDPANGLQRESDPANGLQRESDPANGPVLAALPRRDRIAILAALLGVTVLAWLHLIGMAAEMEPMSSNEMGPMSSMGGGEALEIKPWTRLDFLLMFFMWVVMMVGMMLPSAAPMVLIHAAVGRKAAREGTPLASTAVFVGGYVVAWTLFSLGATVAQWGLDRAALLSPMMVTTSPALGAGLLVAAGLYQLTPAKEACLRHCRSPVQFFSAHWKPGVVGALRMGLEHGAYCLGCCWILMGLLFFGGVMNLLWVAGITLFVLLEKLLPWGDRGGRLAGIGLILLGGVALVDWLAAAG